MKYVLFSGSYNQSLARRVAKKMNAKLGCVLISEFSDGERRIKLLEKVKGKTVFVMQTLHDPGGEKHDSALMEILMLTKACKDAKAKKVVAVIPYLGFARQDRLFDGEPVTIELVAGMFKAAGTSSIIVMNIHSKASFRAFKIRKTRISANDLLKNEITKRKIKDLVVVAPDRGAAKYSKKIAKALNVKMVQTEKHRPRPNVTEIKMVSGNVKGKNCVMFDDMIDTAGTICKNAEALKKMGAKNIYVCAAHGILSGSAVKRLKKAPIKEIILTDSIPLPKKRRIAKMNIVSVADLLAKAIKNY